MSDFFHDLTISSSILSGIVLIFVIIACVVEYSIRGMLDPVISYIAFASLGALVTAVTAERVSTQVRNGSPVLPIEGITTHKTDNNKE